MPSVNTRKSKLVQLGKLLLDVDRITRGGLTVRAWAQSILELYIISPRVYAIGGVIVPQFGLMVGEPLSFSSYNFFQNMCVTRQIIDETIKAIWDAGPTSTSHLIVHCSHPDSHLACAMSPISFIFERPIGLFWALVEKESIGSVLSSLECASGVTAISIYSQRARLALSELSIRSDSPTLSENKIAEYIAESCRCALSASCAITWILDRNTRYLKSVAITGSAQKDLVVDMEMGTGIAGVCANERRAILVDDLFNPDLLKREGLTVAHPDVVERQGWHSGLFVPVSMGDEVFGVIAVYGIRPRAFSSPDIQIAQAFAQRLCSEYVLAQREREITELESRISKEEQFIEMGWRTTETAHDVDNNLIAAQGFLSMISSRFRNDPENPMRRAALSASLHVDNAHKTIAALVKKAKKRKLALGKYNAKLLLQEISRSVEQEALDSGISIQINGPDDMDLRVDREEFIRAILNLLNNSIYWLRRDAKSESKKIKIIFSKDINSALIQVIDNGPGIHKSNLPKLFNTFYTTKGDKGMGWGLANTRRIIREHGGEIAVRSNWGFETEFVISLPLDPH